VEQALGLGEFLKKFLKYFSSIHYSSFSKLIFTPVDSLSMERSGPRPRFVFDLGGGGSWFELLLTLLALYSPQYKIRLLHRLTVNVRG
jgi:hypothetical protein